MESERTTQHKSRQHYGMVVVVEIQRNNISDVTFNHFYSDSREVPRIKASVLTLKIQHRTTREQLMYNARLFRGTKCSAFYRGGEPGTKISYHR